MNMRNIVLCILYLFLVPMGGFAQSEVIVLYPDTENKDFDEAVYQKIFLAGTIDMGKSVDWQKATCDCSGRFRRDGISCSILVEIKG